MNFRNLFICSSAFFLMNCASRDSFQNSKIEIKKEPEARQANLTLIQAQKRFFQVENISYFLEFYLTSTEKFYTGKATIHFDLKHLQSPLQIDFYEGQVGILSVNGKTIPTDYNGKFLLIPSTTLSLGANQIEIEFTNNFNLEGRGLSRFEDPEDKNIYLHTHLEPYNANYVFPCFDQPDLKATYEMDVHAPQDWTIISAVREKSVKEDGDFRIWKFPTSDKFSTYVWSLHAGPFKVWEKNFRIPLRLFARQSLAKYVKTDEWFEPTQQGFDFYEKYFDTKYAFKKYDQLIVPEFTSGAMENVGAVTFNEFFVSRGQKSIREKMLLANVILHEMAPMWFGDLVTMKWWNDLWLNESFATYMASLALTSNTKYKDAWRDFYEGKLGAYFEDELVTTHPIEGEVSDTLHAMANFDSITYGKGGSFLKQSAFYLTPGKFQKGVQLYFKKYAFQNTTLDNFMDSLAEGSGKNLTSWKETWLKTAGVNKVETHWTCENGRIQKMILTQKVPAENPYLRTQRVQIAFLSGTKEELKISDVILFEISKAENEVLEAQGKPCPSLVYPNFEDHAYFRAILDPVSLKTFSENPASIKDSFLRQMVWLSLWDLTREAQLSVTSYLKVAIEKGLASETDNYILKNLFRNIVGWDGNSTSGLFYLSRRDLKTFEVQAQALEELVWKRLLAAPAGSEMQKTLFDGLLSSVRTSVGREKVYQLLQGPVKLQGYVIDQDFRWKILTILAKGNDPRAKSLIAAEAKKDTSFFGQKGLIASSTSFPNWDEKKKWIEEFKSEKHQHSMALIMVALYNVFPYNQENLREDYSQSFFTDLKQVNKTKDASVAAGFITLAPMDCGIGKSDRIGPFLKQEKDLQPPVMKALRMKKQESERCQKIIQTALSI